MRVSLHACNHTLRTGVHWVIEAAWGAQALN
jgi:hypothetical protein